MGGAYAGSDCVKGTNSTARVCVPTCIPCCSAAVLQCRWPDSHAAPHQALNQRGIQRNLVSRAGDGCWRSHRAAQLCLQQCW